MTDETLRTQLFDAVRREMPYLPADATERVVGVWLKVVEDFAKVCSHHERSTANSLTHRTLYCRTCSTPLMEWTRGGPMQNWELKFQLEPGGWDR